ncbi:major facilitator superfamily domain-containing protein [Lipomyces arxii]|uniref:major facilitator superfamily domain-containing protein n=1 Tax=Lipomyces arxii TaxID=56418 RepID=UPI0034CF6E96
MAPPRQPPRKSSVARRSSTTSSAPIAGYENGNGSQSSNGSTLETVPTVDSVASTVVETDTSIAVATGTTKLPPMTRTRSRKTSINLPPPPAMRRSSTMNAVTRQTSNTPSIRSIGMSRKEIYGDAPDDLVQLERLRTIETVASLYTTISRRGGDMTAPDDGQEIADVDPELVTWDGPDDPENPRNWPRSKKWRSTIAMSMYNFLGPFSSSILSPAVPSIAAAFGVTNVSVSAMIMTIFVLAWAVVPLFVAPLSEIFGRRHTLRTCVFVLLIFNIACGLAKNLTQMLVFRFLAGAGGGGPLAIGAGVVADMWDGSERTTAIGLFSIGPTLGPIIAPIASGWITENMEWRWVFWIVSIVSGVLWVFGLFTLPETYAPVLLAQRAKRMRKETNNKALHTVFEITSMTATERLKIAVTRPIILLFTHPLVFGLGLYMAFTYGFLYLLLSTFTTLWRRSYGFSVGMAGTMYIGPGLGFLLGIMVVTTSGQRVFAKLTAKNGGVSKPEFRLPVLVIAAVCMPPGLIWYGWSAEKQLFWIMPVIGAALFGVSMISVFQCIQSYLIDMNPNYAASSTAAGTTFRSLFAFAMPLFATQMYDKLGYGWGNTMLAFFALIIGICFPLFVWFKGEKIRYWADARMDARRERENQAREARIRRKLQGEQDRVERKIENLAEDDDTAETIKLQDMRDRGFENIPEEDHEQEHI